MKILFLAYPIVDTTMGAARDRRAAEQADSAAHIDMHLASMSRLSGIDFSQYPLDKALPALTSNGHQSSVAKFAGPHAAGDCPRQCPQIGHPTSPAPWTTWRA